MQEEFFNGLSTCTFTDEGIYYNWPGVEKKFYPYGSILKIKMLLLGIEIIDKEQDENGNYKKSGFSFNPEDKSRLKEAIAFANQKMNEALCEKAVERAAEKISMQEIEQKKYIAWSTTRVKWRNRGLAILLISALAVLLACFGVGTAFLAIAGAFGIVIGLIMFGRHLEPKGLVRDPKAKSDAKEIVKGAVIGGIVAGEAGAVIGATIAKNKLDNQK